MQISDAEPGRSLSANGSQTAPGQFTLSLGIACQVPQPSSSPDDLVQQSDEGLYSAKTAGRRCMRAHDEG
ncbi:hypothetical protein C7271_26715 [filamentous cyanobacterium CCP5]|nr:hypothetical protein C7271_26715 [filamentous cyanobacterium CCP5]